MIEFWDWVGIWGILFGIFIFFIRPIAKACENLEERITELENKNSNEEESIDDE